MSYVNLIWNQKKTVKGKGYCAIFKNTIFSIHPLKEGWQVKRNEVVLSTAEKDLSVAKYIAAREAGRLR